GARGRAAVGGPDGRLRLPGAEGRQNDSPHAQALPVTRARQSRLDPRPSFLARVAASPRRGATRDRRRVAPPGLAAVLVVPLAVPGRPTSAERGGPRPDRDPGPGQPPVRHRTDPRRATQARRGGQQPLDPALPPATARAAEPDLADLPAQPRGHDLS